MARPLLKYALLVALLAAALPAILYRDRSKAVIDGAHDWVSSLGIYAYPIWVFLHALFIVVCFPGTFAFEGAAGLLFGVVRGSAAVLAAKTLGAAIAFWLGKTLLRDHVRAYVHSYPKFKVVVHGVRRDGWWFVLLARLSPIPSWINNYGLAAVDVRFFPDYIIASCAGTVPFILLNTYAGYLAEQGLSATDTDPTHAWRKYALPVLGFAAAVALFWKLTTYAQHYQETLEAAPSRSAVEDTASEVVFLNEDQSVGPVGGLRSRTKSKGELTFSDDLGLVASPLKKGRVRKEGPNGKAENGIAAETDKPESGKDASKRETDAPKNEEDEVAVVQLETGAVKAESATEQELTSPRRSGRPRKSVTSPAPTKPPSKATLASSMTSPGKRRPSRPKKYEDTEL